MKIDKIIEALDQVAIIYVSNDTDSMRRLSLLASYFGEAWTSIVIDIDHLTTSPNPQTLELEVMMHDLSKDLSANGSI